MNLYVVRHGETAWNAERKLQGKNDIPLNEKGIQQAEEAREALESYEYDVVFSSPYLRASMTARIINETRRKPIFFDYRLRERCFGIYEGMVAGTYDYASIWDYEQNMDLGGETIRDFFERVYDFMEDLKKLRPAENVLIVCHGGTMRAIDCYFHGIKNKEDMTAFFSQNAEVRTYEL